MTAPFWQGTNLQPPPRHPNNPARTGRSRREPGIPSDIAADAAKIVDGFISDLNQHLDAIFGDPHRGLVAAQTARDPMHLQIRGGVVVDQLLAAVRSNPPFSRVMDERWAFLVHRIKVHVENFYATAATTDPYVSPFVCAQMFTEHLDGVMLQSLTPKHLVDGGPTSGEQARAAAAEAAAAYVRATTLAPPARQSQTVQAAQLKAGQR